MRFCKYCGGQIEDEAKICPHCGKELRLLFGSARAEHVRLFFSISIFLSNWGSGALPLFCLCGITKAMLAGILQIHSPSGIAVPSFA